MSVCCYLTQVVIYSYSSALTVSHSPYLYTVQRQFKIPLVINVLLRGMSTAATMKAQDDPHQSGSSIWCMASHCSDMLRVYFFLLLLTGSQQTGLLLLAASYQNGRISCQFRRSFKATHDSEKALGPTNKLHYIVAMNSKSSSTGNSTLFFSFSSLCEDC